MTALPHRSEAKDAFQADIHRTRRGYTLVLRRGSAAHPVLAANGAQPMRWRQLETVLAFLAENYGAFRSVRLNLDE